MFRSVKIGSAFGIPMFLHPTLLLLPLWVLYLHRDDGIGAVLFGQAVLATLFLCVMLHEFGHALMARYFGIGTRDITLYPIGGVARLESTGKHPHEELCIALAGPAVNLVIVLLLSPLVVLGFLTGVMRPMGDTLAGSGGLASVLAGYVFAVCAGNFVLMLFNLLPAFPMDGGRVLRAVLSLFLGQLKATAVAAWIGLALAGGLVLLGVVTGSPGLVLVAVFVAVAGHVELRLLQHHVRRQQTPVFETPLSAMPVMHAVLIASSEPFTGFRWDHQNGVWVRWVNGRPV